VEFNQTRFEAALRVVQLCDRCHRSDLFRNLHAHESLTSTNQTAWELVQQGAPAGTTVLAEAQTAGRGQWGRQWVSAPGGLYLSVILLPDRAIADSAQLTLCTVWGIARALRQIPPRLSGVTTEIPVQIKWLNDLVVQGRKLGGILTETRIQQERLTKAVVGVGINWQNPVPTPGITLRSLLETQPVPLIESLEMLAAITLHGLLSGYQHWQQFGIEAILLGYIDLLAHCHRPIHLNGQPGTIVGVTASGELRVRLQNPGASLTEVENATPTAEVLLKAGTISLGYDA
jgi:BirA family biotin operon repressor/biotin-[acetyl-CoA-carboxylase] ligase